MTNLTEVPQFASDQLVQFTCHLRLAVAAYLARFKGFSREHTDSDLRCHRTSVAAYDGARCRLTVTGSGSALRSVQVISEAELVDDPAGTVVRIGQ
jgi:hypothetical protein